jgi:hypothetical protein
LEGLRAKINSESIQWIVTSWKQLKRLLNP